VNKEVLVLNASDEPLSITTTRRALILVLTGKADPVINSETSWHSARTTVACPSVVRLRSYVHQPYRHAAARPTVTGLVARDGKLCAYCQKRPGTTIDHVLPRSRGGAHSWENTVASCERCNSKKSNKTPSEAGMHLSVTPSTPPGGMWLALAMARWGLGWEDYLSGYRFTSRELALAV